jgi:hypothetical protein
MMSLGVAEEPIEDKKIGLPVEENVVSGAFGSKTKETLIIRSLIQG